MVTNRDQEFMKELMEWIDTNIHDTELTVNDLAVHLKLGRTTMYNKIKSLTGKSPIELIKEYRVTKAMNCLLEPDSSPYQKLPISWDSQIRVILVVVSRNNIRCRPRNIFNCINSRIKKMK